MPSGLAITATLLDALDPAQLLSAHCELRAALLDKTLQLILVQQCPSASPRRALAQDSTRALSTHGNSAASDFNNYRYLNKQVGGKQTGPSDGGPCVLLQYPVELSATPLKLQPQSLKPQLCILPTSMDCPLSWMRKSCPQSVQHVFTPKTTR